LGTSVRQRPGDFIWDDAAIETLKEKYAAGTSVTRIAHEMGCSRDGVVMTIFRQNFPPRPPAPVAPPVEDSKIRNRATTTLPPLPALDGEAETVVDPRLLAFDRRRGCEWPLWSHTARQPTHEYCGLPRVTGRPYCWKHSIESSSGRATSIKLPSWV
jgi:hypothetical protein